MTEQPSVDVVLYPIVTDGELTGELWRWEHDGPHVFVDGRCTCGVLDIGVIRGD